MTASERMHLKVERIKREFPPGTRIELISMSDPFHPVEPGTKGTVNLVDDLGTIHMRWDNGRTLAIIPDEDVFCKIEED